MESFEKNTLSINDIKVVRSESMSNLSDGDAESSVRIFAESDGGQGDGNAA